MEDLAFAVARFFQRGGTFNNYYMVMKPYMMFKAFLTLSYSRYLGNELMPQLFWLLPKQYHGGTNFGRASGGPFVASSYDYDAPIDEYGM